MSRKKLFIIAMLVLPVVASAEVYTVYLQNAWKGLFEAVNGFIWVLGIAPVVVALYAASQAKKDMIREEASQSTGMQQSSPTVDVKVIKTYVSYIVVSLLILYIVYGIFGMAYAGSPSFSTVWEELVHKLWKGWLGGI